MAYPDPIKLGTLLSNSEEAMKWVAKTYPAEARRFLALQHRMGKNCPMSRGVLKLLCYYEAKNQAFVRSVETGVWEL